VFGFLGILLVAMIILVATSYFEQNGIDEAPPEMNLADNQV